MDNLKEISCEPENGKYKNTLDISIYISKE